MLGLVATKIGSFAAQSAVQVGMVGILSGAIVGTTLVAAGVLPFQPMPQPPMVALVDCPGSTNVVARVPSGAAFLITGRSFDGHWVEVYVGEPIDRGWVPANTVRLQSSGERLPVVGCFPLVGAIPTEAPGATAAPLDTFGPPPTLPPAVAVVPTPEPTVLPPGVTPRPTPKPAVSTPHPTVVYPSVFYPSPAPTVYYTPPPPPPPTPTPTPVVTPPPDVTSPALSNLHVSYFCLDATTTYNWQEIFVTATDPDDPVTSVRVTVLPPGGFGGTFNMTYVSNNTWKYRVYWQSNWTAGGYVDFSVYAKDSHNNPSVTLYSDTSVAGKWLQVRNACQIN